MNRWKKKIVGHAEFSAEQVLMCVVSTYGDSVYFILFMPNIICFFSSWDSSGRDAPLEVAFIRCFLPSGNLSVVFALITAVRVASKVLYRSHTMLQQ